MSLKDNVTIKNSWELIKNFGGISIVIAICLVPLIILPFLVPISVEAGSKLADKMFK